VTGEEAEALERCLRAGGVAVLPTDTVYGLACDAGAEAAVRRLYRLKGRAPRKPAAVMFFDRDRALGSLPELGPRVRAALEALLPGPVTALLANPAGRFPLACADDPHTLGLRVPRLAGGLTALAAVTTAVLQSSANLAGGPDPRRVDAVPQEVRRGADLVLDGGELPGTPSTVLDLRALERDGSWGIVREGAAPRAALERALSSVAG
jgi:L-threonylcarbamoyladenylate synthase